MSLTSLADIEGITDNRTQTTFLLAAQHDICLRVAQGACPVRPVEKKARGRDITT